MNAAKKIKPSAIVVKLPKTLDQITIDAVKKQYPELLTSSEVWFDFFHVSAVAKSFYPTLHAFRKEIVDAGIYFKSVNLSMAVKNQFVQSGTYSFLNFSTQHKKTLLDVAFVQPFIDTTINVLQVQSSVKADMLAPYLKSPETSPAQIDIAGVISIVSDVFIGTISLCFPKTTFLEICFNLFGERQEEINPETEDAAAEILNMIFGGAKAELNKNKNYNIQKALPTIIRGESIQVSQTTGATMILPFSSDAGDFHIEIELVAKD